MIQFHLQGLLRQGLAKPADSPVLNLIAQAIVRYRRQLSALRPGEPSTNRMLRDIGVSRADRRSRSRASVLASTALRA